MHGNENYMKLGFLICLWMKNQSRGSLFISNDEEPSEAQLWPFVGVSGIEIVLKITRYLKGSTFKI